MTEQLNDYTLTENGTADTGPGYQDTSAGANEATPAGYSGLSGFVQAQTIGGSESDSSGSVTLGLDPAVSVSAHAYSAGDVVLGNLSAGYSDYLTYNFEITGPTATVNADFTANAALGFSGGFANDGDGAAAYFGLKLTGNSVLIDDELEENDNGGVISFPVVKGSVYSSSLAGAESGPLVLQTNTVYTIQLMAYAEASAYTNLVQDTARASVDPSISVDPQTPDASDYVITYSPDIACFATGTGIRCEYDNVPVEALAVGDIVVTATGASRAIKWIGRRTIERPCFEAWPIRVTAHAFGDNRPARDLHLSPGHPVGVGADEDGSGGCLVPIMCLVNGTSIARVPASNVTYWHVELDEHDILLAEGLPAESYIDLGSRPWFDGVDGAFYDPDLALPSGPHRCRPVALDGPVIEAERRRLDAVFAMRLAAACAWPSGGLPLSL